MDMMIGQHDLSLWLGFVALVAAMLAIDLGVFNRRPHEVKFREALSWSIVWVIVSLMFYGFLDFYLGAEKGTEFITGYLIEKSLSMDNIFVFVMIFSYFGVPLQYKHRVLFWGIIGALVLRAILIFMGAALLQQFHWIMYVFGAFLIFTGFKMATTDDNEIEPEKNRVVRWVRKIYPVSGQYDGTKFFTLINGVKHATPLFIVIVMIGTTDVIFAVDSIPAIFAITLDPFIVLTANVFAVLGLRSMYFLLANIVHKFQYLKYGLSLILMLVGAKMLIAGYYPIPTQYSLMAIGVILAVSMAVSWFKGEEEEAPKA